MTFDHFTPEPEPPPVKYQPPSLNQFSIRGFMMVKTGKLMKLKSVLKKWNSFGNRQSCGGADDESSSQLHPVYVGKSRRRYLLSSDVVHHPLFRELVERSRHSNHDDGDDDTINVSCEVVLFEHLLWMLQNADPQPDSLHDLLEFYSC